MSKRFAALVLATGLIFATATPAGATERPCIEILDWRHCL